MTNWLDDMKADALAIADPDFGLQPGDEIHVDIRYSEEKRWSSVTFEPGLFAIDISVWRPTDRELGDSLPGRLVFKWMATGQNYYHALFKCYLDYEAQAFFVELMERGTRC